MSVTPLPALIQRFFIGRLQTQLGASRHTIAGYRDTFRLLLGYVSQHRQQLPSQLTLEDLDAALLCAFLDHLEHQRGNGIRTRNCRLAALHAFFHFVSYEAPHCLLQCQQVLAIPTKRYAKCTVEFLNEQETGASNATRRCVPMSRNALFTVLTRLMFHQLGFSPTIACSPS